MPQKPSEIRAIILGEHAELRELLHEIEALLDRSARDAAARRALPEHLARFNELFLRHIAHEEEILGPVLADIDNWGPIRIEQMDAEHAEQRAQIHRLSALEPAPASSAYVDEVRGFVRAVLVDMDAEERECLSPNVLRDDTISIDAFGG